MEHNAKSQQSTVAKPELLAFAYGPCSSVGQSALVLTERSLGSNPARGTTTSPACSANCSRGLTSGLRQRQGFYAHCHFGSCARRKQARNDLSQLPN